MRLLQQTGRADVVAAVSTVEEAQQALAPEAGASVDAAFVDVRLRCPERDDAGLAWIRSLVSTTEPPLFVLATAHKKHPVEAFDLGASTFYSSRSPRRACWRAWID